MGSRVNVQLFARDLLAHQGLVSVESCSSAGYVSALFQDRGRQGRGDRATAMSETTDGYLAELEAAEVEADAFLQEVDPEGKDHGLALTGSCARP
jgi:hypothetical protein